MNTAPLEQWGAANGVSTPKTPPTSKSTTPAIADLPDWSAQWRECRQRTTDEWLETISFEYEVDVFALQKPRILGWIGVFISPEFGECFAFPAYDCRGVNVGCHYLIPNGEWRHEPKECRQFPFVGGYPENNFVQVFDRPWDALSIHGPVSKKGLFDWHGGLGAVMVRFDESCAQALAQLTMQSKGLYLWTVDEGWIYKLGSHMGDGGRVMRVRIPEAGGVVQWCRKENAGLEATLEVISGAEVVQISREASEIDFASLDAYYDGCKKEFVMRNKAGRWLSHSSKQFAMLLRTSGVVTTTSQSDAVMAQIIDTRDVHYTGRLAGHPAGFYEANGVRMLVTEAPRIHAPAKGEWPTIHKLIDGLLGADKEHGPLQVLTFLYWMKSAFESVANGKWRPAQILAMAGPVNCGKSLLQRLITECVGGRQALAFRYLSGGTQFNRELFGAEHLVIDDEQASTDYRVRMQMAAHLKAVAVSRDHQCHGKGREAVNLRPIWRCTVSLNDEGECLLVLPPLRADIADKIHIFRCSAPSEPFPTGTQEAQEAFWGKLVGELPAFLHHCLQTQVPTERIDARFGIRAFHHPALVLDLENQALEIVLLELIDAELWRNHSGIDWRGTANQLENLLRSEDSIVNEPTRRLLTWPHACGTFLGRLAKNFPERVQSDRGRNQRAWIIRKQLT